ncbi:MASE1 domain-containing protein [Stenotrophomonas sp.]|uniref:MASE1 domain-containing protein n=1 Tax=Stenotrophomonas sp. TaxID=69392 RepID=UPI002FCB227B
MQLSWLKKEFHLNLRIHPIGVVLAVLYALSYWIARGTSVDQFYLPAGVRVAALLLAPPRYWPYLIAGEYLFFAQARFPLIEKYGLAWVVIASAVLMPTVALIVHAHRRLMASNNESWLLSVAVLAALSVSLLNQGLAYLLMPTLHDAVSWTGVARYVIGDYLGILIFAPLALLWTRRHVAYVATRGWSFALPVSLGLIVLLGLAAMRLPESNAIAKHSLHLAMMFPAIALTCLYGWRGAAVSVVTLNLTIGLTLQSTGLPGSFDDTTFLSQQILAVTGTTLLLLGSTISHHYHRFKQRDRLGNRALDLARISHLASEQDMRERALHMKRISDDIDTSFSKAVEWLKERGHHAPAMDMLRSNLAHSLQFREQMSLVYPTEIEYSGLYVALRIGGIAEAWNATDRIARPLLAGDPCQLSLGLQLAAYRSLSDAVGLLLRSEHGYLQIRTRCGKRGDTRGIVMTIALLDPTRRLTRSTAAQAMELLGGRVLAYGGTVQCRRNRIRLTLIEMPVTYRVPSGLSTDQIMPPAVL